MSSGSPYRSTIVLSEPLQRSIDRLRIHPYTIAHMRFNRRSERPIELTDDLVEEIEEHRLQLDASGFIRDDYTVRSNEEAFWIFQDHDIRLNESDPMTEQEMLDCILMISLRDLEVEVDFETFCNLRVQAPNFFGEYDDNYDGHANYSFYDALWDDSLMHEFMMQQYENIMRENTDVDPAPPGDENPQEARMIPDDNSVGDPEEDGESLPAFYERDLEFIAENNVRAALEHEDTCYVCL